jgi:hypothetical protein
LNIRTLLPRRIRAFRTSLSAHLQQIMSEMDVDCQADKLYQLTTELGPRLAERIAIVSRANARLSRSGSTEVILLPFYSKLDTDPLPVVDSAGTRGNALRVAGIRFLVA